MPNEPQDINIHFDNPPPRKRSKLWDVACILLACGLVGAATGAAWVFPVTACVALLIYAFTEANRSSNPPSCDNEGTATD